MTTSLAAQFRNLLTQGLNLAVEGLQFVGNRLDEPDVTAQRVAHAPKESLGSFAEVNEELRRGLRKLEQSVDRIDRSVRRGVFRGIYPNLTKASERVRAGLQLEPDLINKVIIELQRSLHSSVAVTPEGTSAPGSTSPDPGQTGGVR